MSLCVSIFTQLSVVVHSANCEIHRAVLGTTLPFTVSAATFRYLSSLSIFFSWVISVLKLLQSSSKTEVKFFPRCTIRVLACKIIHSGKNKRRRHRNLPYSDIIWRVSFTCKPPRQYSSACTTHSGDIQSVRTHVSSSHTNLLEQKKCLHKKRVELTQDWLGTPTWRKKGSVI